MEIIQEHFAEERALFDRSGLTVRDCVFTDGESPIKECADIELENCVFHWKYPIWYSKNITVKGCSFLENARAGLWYLDNIGIENSVFDSPKNLRRCSRVALDGVKFTSGDETLWDCSDITLNNVTAHGDYFAMNCRDMRIRDFDLVGKYCFDGVKNVEVRNGRFIGRDLFWNSENVTVHDSFISGEYIGWNSKKLTFVNCTIESLQGLCYIENLVMRNCKLINTTLSFEYSTVDAELVGKIDSVINPSGGRIVCDEIGELIMEKSKVDISKTEIVCKKEIKKCTCA